ncbi:MAG: ABC transporter substrate-binding protein [Ectothiorhodospiraceae bacterium]
MLRTVVATAVLSAAAVMPVVAAPDDPGRFVRATFTEAVDTLVRHRDTIDGDPAAAAELIDTTLAERIDFELVGRLVLGRHVRETDAEQRQRFLTAFRDHLVRAYAGALSEHVDQAVTLVRDNPDMLRIERTTEPDDRGRVTVSARIQLDGGSAVRIRFRLIRGEDHPWRIYDVVVEGFSLIAHFRSEFGTIARREGIDGLIRRLEDHSQPLVPDAGAIEEAE